MKLMMLAGISAKPIERTKTMNTPFTPLALSLSATVTGNGAFSTVNLRLGLPVAYFRIASYMN